MTTARLVRLEGTFNLRDLGGYQTQDGHTVRPGLVYRGDALHRLTDADLARLEDLGIRVIVDFRSPAEVAAHPDRLPAGATWVQFSQASELAALASSDGDAEKLRKLEHQAATAEGRAWLTGRLDAMEATMRSFANDPVEAQPYRDFLHLLAASDPGPVIFHCRGGKDRTGWAAALLLLALGVPRETVMADYLATAQFNRARNEARMDDYRRLTSEPLVLEFLASLMQVKERYLDAALAEVEQLGGTTAYLESFLGLTPDLLDRLRSRYLR